MLTSGREALDLQVPENCHRSSIYEDAFHSVPSNFGRMLPVFSFSLSALCETESPIRICDKRDRIIRRTSVERIVY